MESTTSLLILQYISFTATTMMALLLLFARIHTQHLNNNYETSRWLLFIGLVLYCIHYQLQIQCGFRAKGDDVGALINILFYTPVVYIFSFVTIKMAGIEGKRKIYLTVASISFMAILASFLFGWFKYHSLHMHSVLYVMGGLFFATLLFFIIYPARKIRNRRRQIEDETAGNINYYNIYMTTGTILLFAMALLMPVIIYSSKLLVILGPVFLIVIFFYVVCFVALGFNLDKFSDIIEDTNSQADLSSSTRADALPTASKLTENEITLIETALEQFIQGHGYSNPDLNATIVARRIGVSKNIFTQYLYEHKGQTFRVWLSNLRVEQAKKMLLTTNYSNETIATECGFSSRSWMQQKFKATTGLTPNEWKESQL